MQKWQQWESASDADWGLAVQREAVIRPLAERQRLCTEDVEEAARHLGIGRSVLYCLVLASTSLQATAPDFIAASLEKGAGSPLRRSANSSQTPRRVRTIWNSNRVIAAP